MSIAFDKNNADKPVYPTPPVDKQVHLFIGQCENSHSNAGNKMLVLNCAVMEDSEGAGFDCKKYLVEGPYFNYNAACIMNAVGIDPDAIDEVDDMTFRGFDCAVIFQAKSWISKKDGKEKTGVEIKQFVPRSEATIPLAPAPKSSATESAMNAQAPPEEENTDPDYEATGKIPF